MKQLCILLFVVTMDCSVSTIEVEDGFDLASQESTDEFTESAKNHSQSSCKWVAPPENGVNFRPCALGACKGVRGIFSKNGTRRLTHCNPHYVLVQGFERDVCHNGEWSSRGHECVQCGKSPRKFDVLESAALIIAGYNSSRGDFPWMAALFTPLDGGLWTQICGGTLISPNIVLTAAHCLQIDGKNLKPNEVKVGLGRLSVDFYKHEPGGVVSSVKELLTQEQFVGLNRLYDLDISLIVLEERVPIDNLIMPACIDWRGLMKPKHDDVGVLAGWGLTDVDGFRSETLKWTYQRYIGYQECLKIMTASDHKFLSPDKFCTDEVKGGRAESGDSGGGLMFERGGVHYVYGIVSTKMLLNAKQLRLFTNVLNEGHRAWLGEQWHRLQTQPLRVSDRKGGCSKDSHCASNRRCVGQTCLDLCPAACGFNSVCRMVNHLPVCTCSAGHTGNPYASCTEASTLSHDVQRDLGDVCKQNGLDLWICKPEKDCPRAAEALREGRVPQPCSRPELVCCEPDVNKPFTQLHHMTMCRWYSQFVGSQVYDAHAQVYYVRDSCLAAPLNIRQGQQYPVKRGDFPHMGIIGDKDFNLFRYGSLINEFYFLTSYISVDSLAVRVRLGIFGSPPGDGLGQPEFEVKQKHTYPDFKGDQLHNLMLCRLDSAVKFTPYIRPACLVFEHQYPGSHVIVTGKVRNSLTAMTSTVVPRFKCLSSKALYDDSVICVESNKTHEDLDILPGFALMTPLKEPYCSIGLLGVSSFGYLKSGRVEGYMRLSYYVPWIESILWPLRRPVIPGIP